MKRHKIYVFVITLFLLGGCEPLLPTKELNELDIIQGAGYDEGEGDLIQSYFVFPIFKGGKEPPTAKTISGIGDSSKESRQDASRKTRFHLVSGQIRIILFSKSLSEKGIFPILDTYNRDPSIGRISQLAIVDGKTKEVFNKPFKEVENIALHLQEMVEQSIRSETIPNIDFNSFMYQYYQDGYDPYLPIISVKGDEIIISSLGIMKDDKLVMEVSKADTFIFLSLVEKQKNGFHQATMANGDKISLESIKSKPAYQIKMNGKDPTFTISINMKVRIMEYSSHAHGSRLLSVENIEKQLESQLKRDGLRLITQFQKEMVDPLGLGAKYEAHYRAFDSDKWKGIYPNVPVQLDVKVHVIQTGISE
ncbi:Ger(x)C family spore germination protein [Neobacillus sp. NPDC093182]|uniref:Ger(x)C family spore germination protein n=1 Tax=Neobacillus sp. NPDC093182 TaxID=3364297 RepID=UPI003822E25A